MTYKVIDSDNYQASGIETLFFPGGEPHAKIPKFPDTGELLFVLKARTWNDTGLGACVWDALANSQNAFHSTLFIPYYPGARQERSDGTAPVTRDIIESMFFAYGDINVFDIHSEHRNVTNWMPSDLGVPIKDDVVGIIAPDTGATERANDFRKAFYPNAQLLQCSKKRNPHTGRLSNYKCPDLPAKGRYIIVDDICDGGGTFNLLAEAFFNAKFGQKSNLELFVSHGIFSKGLDAIDRRIEHITTTDSWCTLDSRAHSRITVLPLAPLFDKIMGEI